ncbi:MAG TPA: cupin domain-containing protein [Nitrososphaeraceae archaeon]|nr:cupin domain-containing protein [Nitrososphaeraceae archaeon]
MESIHELGNILSMIKGDDYFVDFLNTKSLDAGIIRLRENQKDTQSSHPEDEIYYVIEGNGFISIKEKDYAVQEGTVIFIPANMKHKFHGNKEELVVLYILPRT